MLKVGVGSKNPAKIKAVEDALKKIGYLAEVVGFDVKSNVSDQPLSDDETIQGALNRAKNIMVETNNQLDYAIGLEGGVVKTQFGVFLCNWGAVINKAGMTGIGGGQRVQLPEDIYKELEEGKELGDVIDVITGRIDVKKNEGTIGILTNNHITRSKMFQDVVICAFSRFFHPDIYHQR